MKVFSLVTERGVNPVSIELGLATTNSKRIERLYAAREFRDVWEFAQPFEKDGETIISIAEVSSAIQVL